jgi:hypothetical protein
MGRPAARFALIALMLASLGVRQAAADPPTTPARPAEGDVHDKVARLWDAIVHDDPAVATAVFFPREPFLRIKAMADPGRYYDRLRARFDQDIHTLHATTPDLGQARFVRFELARRGGYVLPGEEGNRLAYWASRHSRLVYRVGGAERALEVRVLIAWEDHWFVIHLNEFRR